ncbi:MAG: caspase family protein [Myxococcota bacterium]
MSLYALLIGVSAPGLNVSLAMDRLTPVLNELGFARVERCVGDNASRKGMLSRIDALANRVGPEDGALLYYFGHGGRVRFPELPAPAGEHTFGYVTCKKDRGAPWEAILDQELSTRLTALDAKCGNVTAILDCCFSGELVRDVVRHPSEARQEKVTDWVREALADDETLAVDSHPRIVRLTGASPKRQAYAVERSGRHIGRLTEAFITAVGEAGERPGGLTWATAEHRIREHVIGAMGMEGQWVNVAGPARRRLFSRDSVALPGTVTFLPGESPDHGWLRAGWLQGVQIGDRWVVGDPCVDGDGQLRALATATVAKVDRNRAEVRVERTDGASSPLVAGMPAYVEALAQPIAVALDPADTVMQTAVAGSPWLAVADADADERIEREGAGWRVASRSEGEAVLEFAADEAATALAALEDRARMHTLRRAWAEQEPSAHPLQWSWRRVGDDAPLPHEGATLTTNDRIRVDVTFEGTAPLNWFVAAIVVDPAGRPHLLSARVPQGLELGPGDSEVLGVRHGRAQQGLPLPWPDEVEGSEGTAALLIVASRRPIALQHLVHPQAADEDAAFTLQGMASDTERGHKPETSKGCAWERIPFNLRRS